MVSIFIFRGGWQFQDERGTFAHAFTLGVQQPAHLLGGVGAAMKTKTMAFFLGREAVAKNPD